MLTSSQRIVTLLELKGGPAYAALMDRATYSTEKLALANRQLAMEQQLATKSSFAHNQMLFTQRRLTFYATLGTFGLAAAVGKMGFAYLNTFAQVQAAVGPFLKGTGESIDHVTNQLFKLAAFTPFTFQQVARAFQMMFVGMKGLGVSAAFTVETLQRTTDLLSAGGTLTELSLRRVSNALQDMAYQGTLTGRMVQRLAQIGIPIREILRKELGLTGDQIANIKDQSIDALTVLRAINKFAKTEPGFSGAALRLQTRTLAGAWTTFTDLLSQASGQASAGAFEFIRKTLVGVSVELGKFYTNDKPITVLALARAFDQTLSPKTHLILNTVIALTSAFKTFIGTLYILIKAVQTLLHPLDFLFGSLDRQHRGAQILGYALGVLGALYVSLKIKALAFAVAEEIVTARTWWATRAMIAYETSLILFSKAMKTAALWTVIYTLATIRLRDAFLRAAVAATTFDIAVLANPVGIAIAAVVALTAGLVVLYFKWRAFHDFVDRTFHLMERFPFLAFLVPIIGQLVLAVIIVKHLHEWLSRIFNLLQHPLGHSWIGRIAGIAKYTNPFTAPIAGANFLAKHLGLPHHQHGGTMSMSGMALVGEGGPEIVTLPAGSQVTPISGGTGGAGPFNFPSELILKTILRVDGKDLAEVVASHRLDRQARR